MNFGHNVKLIYQMCKRHYEITLAQRQEDVQQSPVDNTGPNSMSPPFNLFEG